MYNTQYIQIYVHVMAFSMLHIIVFFFNGFKKYVSIPIPYNHNYKNAIYTLYYILYVHVVAFSMLQIIVY